MRIISLFLATLLFIPMFSNAQDREFDDTIMVLNTSNGQGYEDLAEGCAWADPYVPSGIEIGMTFDLSPASVNEESGIMHGPEADDGATSALEAVVTNGSVSAPPEAFGELWVCAGPMEFSDDPLFGTIPERIVAYVIAIGDNIYGALGRVKPHTYLGMPQEGMAVWTGGAQVVNIVDDMPAGMVGAMSVNVPENRLGIHGYYDGLVVTLRIFEPRNPALEAAAEAL